MRRNGHLRNAWVIERKRGQEQLDACSIGPFTEVEVVVVVVLVVVVVAAAVVVVVVISRSDSSSSSSS